MLKQVFCVGVLTREDKLRWETLGALGLPVEMYDWVMEWLTARSQSHVTETDPLGTGMTRERHGEASRPQASS